MDANLIPSNPDAPENHGNLRSLFFLNERKTKTTKMTPTREACCFFRPGEWKRGGTLGLGGGKWIFDVTTKVLKVHTFT